MDIEKLSEEIVNVGMGYAFFEFHAIEKNNHVQFYFPIKQIRSFKNSGARPFGKHISRTLSLTNFEKERVDDSN